MREALPVGTALATRGLVNTLPCKRCNALESTTHMLWTCPFARGIWTIAPITNLPDLDQPNLSAKQLLQLAKRSTTLPHVGLTSTPLHPWLLYSIWTTRNQLIFEDRSSSQDDVVSRAVKQAKDWQQAQHEHPLGQTRKAHQQPKPSPGTYQCYIDGAWQAHSLSAGMGWILKDDEGRPITQGSASRPYVPSVIAAEALAIREALTANHK
ncbi:unnamed protein product [Thlaspi arvense]|uniref:Reverse transcriptase zinc-binding domain-containing protein n=1 Tax=Thlaspi arvense TaxID=13288 RepID=A0AAU9SK74_THLAR|nr:unnamed protein product [Thlaspi arvense]